MLTETTPSRVEAICGAQQQISKKSWKGSRNGLDVLGQTAVTVLSWRDRVVVRSPNSKPSFWETDHE
jgi:hypothetical protein